MRLTLLYLLISFSAISQTNQGLRFIQNKGQWNPDIDFQAQVPGGRVGVSAQGFSIQLVDMDEIEHRHLATHEPVNESGGHGTTEPIDGHFFRINLVGSNTQSRPVADGLFDGYYNYFLGRDSCQWATRANAYATIVFPEVYPGIDMRVSSVASDLKYDFIVRPGGDPSLIKLEYAGVSDIQRVDDELRIHTVVGTLTELTPYSYQLDGNARRTVSSAYQLRNNFVTFSLPDGYDECNELVIDPLLIFSTYSGSTADNWGSTATPGEHGTLYSAGVTRQSLGGVFPATAGAFQISNRGSFDMGIIKYDSAGTRFLYATYIGGAGNDSPESLVVDKVSGDLIVLGISSSTNYPTSPDAFDKTFNLGATINNPVLDTDDQWDIVITRLSANGNLLVGSTFLGGSGNDGLNKPKHSGGPLVANYGDEMRGDVITDEAGNVYISSVTSSADFPAINGFDNSLDGLTTTDGVVVKLAPDLSSIVWSNYIGGSGFDAAYSIKFDVDQNIVLAGGTTSANFPATAGAYQTNLKGIVDGWIARISADGTAIMHATYTGTTSFDQVYFVDINSSGNVFCYGQTAGHMPVTPGVYHNVNTGQFLQKFSPDLSSLVFSTVFGGASLSGLVIPNISPTAFLVNDCDNIYMAGWGGFINSSSDGNFWQSNTRNMPITNDAYQRTTSGSDFYFIVLNGDATELVYSTFLGGTSSKTHVDGGTSRFDKYGIVYHAVCAGCAGGNSTGHSTSDFPTTPNAKSRINRSTNCNNAAFKFDLSTLRAIFDTNNTSLTAPGFNNVCFPDSIVFENQSTGGKVITWDFGDGTVVVQDPTDPRSITHQYQMAGSFSVKLKVFDISTCSQIDSTYRVINYFMPNITVGRDDIVCEGNSFRLTASGGVTYSWQSQDGTFTSAQQSPFVKPDSATVYFVTVTDANGCMKKDTLNLAVRHNVHARFETYDLNFSKPGYNNVCYPDSILFKNHSLSGEEFVWDFDDGTTINKAKTDTTSIVHGFQAQQIYYVTLKAYNDGTCNKVDSVTKAINYFRDEIEVGDDAEICAGTTFQLTATGGHLYSWFTQDNSFTSSVQSPVVQPLTSTEYFVTVRDVNSCMRRDTVLVSVVDSVHLEWAHALRGSCTEHPSVIVRNLTEPEDEVEYFFDFGDGTTSTETDVEHFYEGDGSYVVRFVGRKRICSFEEWVELPVYKLRIPNVFTPEVSPGHNDSFAVFFGADMIVPADEGMKVQLEISDRWGKTVFESQDYRNDWTAPGLASGIYFYQVKVGDLLTCKDWLHIMK